VLSCRSSGPGALAAGPITDRAADRWTRNLNSEKSGPRLTESEAANSMITLVRRQGPDSDRALSPSDGGTPDTAAQLGPGRPIASRSESESPAARFKFRACHCQCRVGHPGVCGRGDEKPGPGSARAGPGLAPFTIGAGHSGPRATADVTVTLTASQAQLLAASGPGRAGSRLLQALPGGQDSHRDRRNRAGA
jgi:hypothetical protein